MVKAQRKREEKGNQNRLGVRGKLKGETGKISRSDELEIEGEGKFKLRWVIRDGKEKGWGGCLVMRKGTKEK
jgi:hypothetical protein